MAFSILLSFLSLSRLCRRRENKEERLRTGFGSYSVALAVRGRNEKMELFSDCSSMEGLSVTQR